MRRPVRRSRLLALASLAMLVATTVLTVTPTAIAAGPKTDGAHAGAIKSISDVQAGSRGSIDVSKLSRPAGSRSSRPQLPYLETRSKLTQAGPGSGPVGVGPSAVPPPPARITPAAGSDATGPAWDGFSFADSGRQPPDPWVAVGPEHVVQTVNTVIQIFDRVGTVEVPQTEIGIPELFNLPPGFGNSDPRVVYDSLHGRWIGTEVSWTCDGDGNGTSNDPIGYIDWIVSRTADPTGIWDLFFWGFLEQLPDFPSAGTSTDKVAFTGNLFTLADTPTCDAALDYAGSAIVVLDWAEILALGGSNFILDGTEILFSPEYGTPRVGLQMPATSTTLHVVLDHINTVTFIHTSQYLKLTGTVAASTISASFDADLATLGIVEGAVDPPFPLQPGGSEVTESIDARPTDAIWQNGLFTWVSTNGCTPSGDSTPRNCVRVTQLNTGGAATSPPTLAQDFLIAENGKDNYFGGIGQSGNGTLHVVWTHSSTAGSDEPSSETAYQLPTDGPNTLKGRHDTGTGTGTEFTGGRWGDYVGVAQDPQVPNAVWQANQFATGGENWQTKVSQLQTGGATYVPIEPLRVLDSRINLGVTGIFNASTPKSFTVAGFTSGGGTIPADAIAVTGNVTVTGQTAAGYVSITTTPTSTPGSSTLNFPTSDTRANNLTTPIASNGKLSAVYKAAAGKKAHIIFDVTGYFLPGPEDAGYNTLDPIRVLDSRAAYGIGLTGRFQTGTPRELVIAGNNGVPGGAVAVTANLTVVGQTKAGFVSVTPTSIPAPTTSNINFPVGDTRANGLTAKLGAGSIWLVYKGAAGSRTDLILDVTGYYLPAGDGLVFHALNPGRIMDTRTSVLSGLTGTFNHNVSRPLDTDGHWGVPAGAKAVTGNLTVTGQTKAGYVSITPDPDPAPTTSTINFPLGDTRANGVTVPLGGGNMSLIYKASSGKKTHLILDVTGYFE
jgi:hypothetical protein